ncbi:SAF domain-containing protein [Bosea sp. OK403]|uniref:UxaA family hydrolase n=1 Tax=Bosea sp. OK403 TaxID=1855286 RepID=UPI0008ECE7EF|nr:UxaA family hydrolase [Bosea sp. OK403]SFH97485.1 SAF domain-containing protein [Bosea sp. OK403]
MSAPVPVSTHDPRLILLDPRDNVFVARMRLPAGEAIETGAGKAALDRDIPLAHKIARRAIAPGEKILKYGAPIGVATVAIAAGCHVHVQNMKSDYTPTYHLEDERKEDEHKTGMNA